VTNGQIDFGGSEYVAAGASRFQRNSCGWKTGINGGNSDAASYFLECNEALDLAEK